MKLGFVAVLLLFVVETSACPSEYPLSACGRCWVDQNQARSGGCREGGSGSNRRPNPQPSSRNNRGNRSPSPRPNPRPNPQPSGGWWNRWNRGNRTPSRRTRPSPQPRPRPNPQPNPRPNPQPNPRPNPRPNPQPTNRGNRGGNNNRGGSGPLLFIGQDTNSIDEYVRETGKTPAGLTGYTSVRNLEGLTSATDYGTGNQHLQYLANKYPNSDLALGVYVVDQLEEINNGGLRGNLEKLIDTLAGMNRKIYFRFGYEADGTWNRYDPSQYQRAFRTAWEIVQNKGVSNKFVFVWQLATYCAGTYQGNPFSAWYPGDQYVDYVGISTFTQNDCNWGPQNDVVRFARQHGKPVMISEAANQGYQNDILNWRNPIGGGDERRVTAEQIWNDWYAPWFQWIQQNSNSVKVVAYISADWDSQSNWNSAVNYANGYWGDTRVTANNYIKQQWMQKVRNWGHA